MLSCEPLRWRCEAGSLDCVAPERSEEYKKIVASLAKLEELRTKNGGTYIYSVLQTSWVGKTLKRAVTVTNGIVEKQVLSRMTGGPTHEEIEVFVEKEHNIARGGYPAATLEVLHAACLQEIEPKLRDKRYSVFIESYPTTQFLKQCTYVDKQCADDCSNGVIDQLTVE